MVDDEPYITDLLGAALRFEGFAVETAATGGDAIDLAERGHHDLVLLDVMLPDVDGTEVCRRMRAQGNRTPVLFLTARDATEDKVVGLTAGGDDYVTKPFSLDELVARIHAVLRRTTPDREHRPSAVLGPRDGRRDPRGVAPGRAHRADRHGVQPVAVHARERPPGAVQERDPRPRLDTTTSTAIPTSSRPTSATCARRSTASTHR